MSILRPDYIDRDLPLTRKQRRAIWRDAWKLWRKRKLNYALYFGDVFGMSVLIQTPWTNLIPTLAGHGILARALQIGVPAVMGLIGVCLLQRYRFAPLVRLVTWRHGWEVCQECGYWLRALGDDVTKCPECGTKREGLWRSPASRSDHPQSGNPPSE